MAFFCGTLPTTNINERELRHGEGKTGQHGVVTSIGMSALVFIARLNSTFLTVVRHGLVVICSYVADLHRDRVIRRTTRRMWCNGNI